ncbi:MAG: hypothetical protein MJK12_20040 [Colwellia sp.]|nr:hypothetical protein [Colwellia sp.]
MSLTLPPSLLIQTWIDIATVTQYPEAQEIARKRLHMFFDDVNQAILYLEMEKTNLTSKSVINNVNQLAN